MGSDKWGSRIVADRYLVLIYIHLNPILIISLKKKEWARNLLYGLVPNNCPSIKTALYPLSGVPHPLRGDVTRGWPANLFPRARPWSVCKSGAKHPISQAIAHHGR